MPVVPARLPAVALKEGLISRSGLMWRRRHSEAIPTVTPAQHPLHSPSPPACHTLDCLAVVKRVDVDLLCVLSRKTGLPSSHLCIETPCLVNNAVFPYLFFCFVFKKRGLNKKAPWGEEQESPRQQLIKEAGINLAGILSFTRVEAHEREGKGKRADNIDEALP